VPDPGQVFGASKGTGTLLDEMTIERLYQLERPLVSREIGVGSAM